MAESPSLFSAISNGTEIHWPRGTKVVLASAVPTIQMVLIKQQGANISTVPNQASLACCHRFHSKKSTIALSAVIRQCLKRIAQHLFRLTSRK